jgi:phage-related protein
MSDFLPPVVMELRAKASQVSTELAGVRTEMAKTVASTESGGVKMQAAFNGAAGAGKALLLGVAGAAVVVGAYSLKAAMAAQVTDAKLSVSIKNAGGSYKALKPQIDAVDASNRKLGESNTDTNTALATLTTALHDPKKALADLAIATNLARAKNIDLNSAALLVAKTSEGQSKGLKALGIDLPTVAGGAAKLAAANQLVATDQAKANSILSATPGAANSASKAHQAYEAALKAVTTAQAKATAIGSAGGQMLSALSSRVKGAASAFGDTLAGKLKQAQAGIENIAEQIGAKLIPIVIKVISGVQDMGKWFSQNKGVAMALGITIGSLAAILIGAYVAQKAIAAGMKIMKVATVAANVVAGIFGITTKASTAASYEQVGATYASVAAQKAYAVGLGISKVATAIATAAQWLFNAALDANPVGIVVLAIGLLIAAIVLIATHWKQVSSFLMDSWKNVSSFFMTIGSGIAKWWNGFWNGIVNFAIDLFKWYIGIYIGIFMFLWNGLVAIGASISNWWNGLWSGITSYLTNLWNAEVKGWTVIFEWLHTTLVGIGTNIANWWNGLWSGFGTIVQGAFKGVANFVIGFFNTIIDAVNTVISGLDGLAAGIKNITGGAINFSLGKIPHIPSFDVGGIVPGATGAPMLATVHGSERILSNDMMSGRQQMPAGVADAVNRQQRGSSGPGNTGPTHVDNSRHVTVQVETNATPERIASAAGWKLRQKG